jgi:alpha-tubulin suppressor-like RCC1 family protein
MEFTAGFRLVGGGTFVAPPPSLPPSSYLWAFGDPGRSLGVGDTITRSSPVQVGSLGTWSKIRATGVSQSFAIKTDGTMWAWGSNSYGSLGLGDTTSRSSPVQIGALTTWATVDGSTGYWFAGAIKTDGTLWTWGYNAYSVGILGLGNTTNYSSPKQVGALTNWLNISASSYGCMATKTDGTLWAWGGNSYGRLGLGDKTNRNSPVQVGAGTTWSTVSAKNYYGAAIKTDGTLWTWGYNYYGTLGIGSTTNRSSPVQVGSLTNWSVIHIVTNGTMLAVKTDGTLWGWGNSGNGQLGLSAAPVSYSSPKQIGALTTWQNVSGGAANSSAIKTDGTVWTWGNNAQGQLGLGNTTSYSSPKQVGALTTWAAISSAGHTLLISS